MSTNVLCEIVGSSLHDIGYANVSGINMFTCTHGGKGAPSKWVSDSAISTCTRFGCGKSMNPTKTGAAGIGEFCCTHCAIFGGPKAKCHFVKKRISPGDVVKCAACGYECHPLNITAMSDIVGWVAAGDECLEVAESLMRIHVAEIREQTVAENLFAEKLETVERICHLIRTNAHLDIPLLLTRWMEKLNPGAPPPNDKGIRQIATRLEQLATSEASPIMTSCDFCMSPQRPLAELALYQCTNERHKGPTCQIKCLTCGVTECRVCRSRSSAKSTATDAEDYPIALGKFNSSSAAAAAQ